MVARRILQGQDVVCIAPTGAGKTLTFWLPLLHRPEGIVVVITPLNVLGSQNREGLARLGIEAVTVDRERASDASTMRVCGAHTVLSQFE